MNSRLSNIELLRIICMFFVVLLHFNNHGANKDLIFFTGDLTLQNTLGHLIESFAIIAVNCFVLISGYFGISFKIRNILKLYLQCFFIGVIGYLLYVIFTDNLFDIAKLCTRVFAFTRNKYWFLYAYLFLIFISPLLNFAIDKMTKMQYRRVVLLLSIFMLYFSYMRNVGDNTIGMSYVQFIYLYLIARYLGLYVSLETIKRNRYKYLIGYIIMSLCTFLLALVEQSFHLQLLFLRPYPYNSFFIVLGAIFFLLFMLSIDIQSNVINWFSSSIFAVYLLQENPYFGFKVLYPWVETIFMNIGDNLVLRYCLLFAGSLFFVIITVGIDKLCGVLSKPILMSYDKYVAPKLLALQSKIDDK